MGFNINQELHQELIAGLLVNVVCMRYARSCHFTFDVHDVIDTIALTARSKCNSVDDVM